jgi:thioredoxin reductase (NADPH)
MDWSRRRIASISVGVFAGIVLLGIIFYELRLRYITYSACKASRVENSVPVLVVGSGPAGLSAALYAGRAGYHTVVISGNRPGGELVQARKVENWPTKEAASGARIMDDLTKQVKQFGVVICQKEACSIDASVWPFKVVLDDGTLLRPLSLVLAMGGSQKVMDLPGVDQLWGRGIGVCTICDAPFDVDKDVVVIGGGDAAIDKALQLTPFARHVTILVRATSMLHRFKN